MAEEPNSLPAALEAKVGEVLKKLPPEQGKAVRSVLMQVVKSHSGPLPDPESLAQYNVIIKDGAERLMRIVEKEQEHRHGLDKRMVTAEIRFGTRGQWIGFALTLLLAAGAVFLGLKGHDWLAGGIVTTTIVGVVAVFVAGRRSGSDDSESEPEPEPPPQQQKNKRK